MPARALDPSRITPTPLDVAAGWMLGSDEGNRPLPDLEAPMHPTTVLEEIVLPALANPPCLVSFSGGRDSSAVLAVAATVARREGLPLPIPVTIEPRGVPSMNELRWQELVLAHLGLPAWERITVDDELDVVGDVAQRLLMRHGLLYPPTFTLLAVLLARREARSVLTGISGDAYFGGWRFADLSAGLRGMMRPRSALAAGYAVLPRFARARFLRHLAPAPPWLRPDAQRRLTEEWSAGEAGQPVAWNSYVAWRTRLRRMLAMTDMTRLVGEAAGCLVVNPLEEPRFLSALADAGGRRGFGGRTAIMRVLFSHLLPEAVIVRSDKARITPAVFRGPATEFALRWRGEGVDDALVDHDALRAVWLAPDPDLRSALLLQAAWVASETITGPEGDTCG